MDIPRNTVWVFAGTDTIDNGLYRILEVLQDVGCIVLFPLENSAVTIRPTAISIESFIEQVKSKKVKQTDYSLPNYLLVAEEDVSSGHVERRDRNYELIKQITSDKAFLFDYATKKRVPYLAQYALRMGVDRKKLARLLTQYWRNGQDKMALLPAFSHSGGTGKERTAKDIPLGAPKRSRTVAIDRALKYNISDSDKTLFRKALKKYYLKETGTTLAKAYKNMLIDSYANEVRLAEACGRKPHVPTLKQFSYWYKKQYSQDEIIKSRTSENDHLRNKRTVLGCVSQDSFLPGSYFEIDATVADVHIVSELGAQYVIGRPTIYMIVDRASRMIVGMHVSLYHASWRAARQALVNCFLPKSDYCRQFDIQIDDSEWPCAHIPRVLVCDNGEMIGLEPQKALTPMTQLSFTPPYRPDCKGVVEKRFDILNKEVIHELLGTTRGGNVVRGSRDPRKDAIYTLKEVTALIIKAVLEHNRSILDDLALSSPLLIENDFAPTPVNYWKIHVAKHKHDLKSSSSDDVIARLLPPAEVSMTRSGIHFNGLYYSCEQVEELNLASIARTSGRWQLNARIDENTTDYIYVRLDKNEGFTKCHLLPRSRMFGGKTMIEADFMQDWLDSKKELAPVTVASIDDHKQRQKIARDAKNRSKSSEPTTFAQKVKGTRQRRKEEIEATTNVLAPKDNGSNQLGQEEKVQANNAVRVLPRGRKRKAKVSDS